ALFRPRFEPPCSPRPGEPPRKRCGALRRRALPRPEKGKRRRPCCGRRSLSLAAPPLSREDLTPCQLGKNLLMNDLDGQRAVEKDRKSTRLNSSHVKI